MAAPPVKQAWHDAVVADQLGVSVRWLRENILEKHPGTFDKRGRRRFLNASHIRRVEAIMAEMGSGHAEGDDLPGKPTTTQKGSSCRSNHTNVRLVSSISGARSKDDVLTRAVALATQK